MKLRRPSPALVVSIIALVVACAGTAYAATQITSSSQIKNGIVTGADLRNSTITNSDIRKESVSGSRLRKNSISLNRLSSGTQRLIRGGTAGSSEDAGALEAVRKSGPEDQPAGGLRRVTQLSVPAGSYVITAKTIMTPILDNRNLFEGLFADDSGVSGECTLDVAGDADKGRATIAAGGKATPATIYTQITRTLNSAGTIALDCGSNVPWRTSDTSIIATGVEGVTRR